MSLSPRSTVLICLGFLVACNDPTPAVVASHPAKMVAAEPGRRPSAPKAVGAADSPAIAESRLLEFARRIAVECDHRDGHLHCIGGKPENGDIYDVELRPDCGPDGFFGGVVEERGAELRNALPPKDTKTLATLSKGQIVCIEAIGRAGHDPSYFYVSTLPVVSIAACSGNRLCETYGDRKVENFSPPTPCPVPGRASKCAAGWIDADMVEAFENGM